MKNKIIIFIGFLVLNSIQYAFSQVKAGKITFERKTNLEKKFKEDKDSPWMAWLKDNKYKVDVFELYFNDTCSLFKPQESDELDKIEWATKKNTVYQAYHSNYKLLFINIFGKEVYISDSINERQWKITDSKRTIGKYECIKAIFQMNDSTKIYAWYAPEIVPSIGPEGFCGLPGAILGLATEDGGIVYFAKSVELIQPKEQELKINVKKKSSYTMEALIQKLQSDYGSQPWFKEALNDIFGWL